MSHGTHVNESWHTYEWVMAHIWMSHGTHMNESCHTYEWVMAQYFMCDKGVRRSMWYHVCRSVLKCVAICCSVLQCVVVLWEDQCDTMCVAVCCSVLQCVVVCCSVLQCVAVCCQKTECILYRVSESYVVVCVEWQSTQDRMYSLLSIRKLCSCVCRGAVYRRPSHIRCAPLRDLVKVKGHTSCNTYEIRYGTHMNETCHTYEWLCKTFWHSTRTCTKLRMLSRWKSMYHIKWDMAHIRMRHVTHMNKFVRLSDTLHAPARNWGCWSRWWKLSHATHAK